MSRETKYKRSQKSLSQTMKAYYPDSEIENSSYYIMSQSEFYNNGSYEDVWEVAVQVIISTFNSVDTDRKHVVSEIITKDMIYDRFNIISTKPARIKKKIDNALESLEKKGIITIAEMKKGITKKEYFVVIQKNVKSKDSNENKETDKLRYFKLVKDEVFNIIFHSESDNDRANLLATYASMISKMNNLDYAKAFPTTPPTYTKAMALLQAINYSTYTKIAESISVSRNSAEKYVNQLIDMEVIACIKVHKQKDDAYQWSHYYSKYSERKALKEFVETLLLETELPNNSENGMKNYSHLNIDDVWDETIHCENAEAKQVKNDTQNDSDAQVDEDSHLELQDEIASQNTSSIDAGDTDGVVTVEVEEVQTKPKINIEIAEFAKQFILEDENDEEDFFYMTGQQLMAEYVKK